MEENQDNLNLFISYFNLRNAIKNGMSTGYDIFNNNHFCNNDRNDDKFTKKLFLLLDSCTNINEKILNILFHRQHSNNKTIDFLGKIQTIDDTLYLKIKKHAEIHKFYTSRFLRCINFDSFFNQIKEIFLNLNEISNKILNMNKLEDLYLYLKQFKHIGDFMAYQICCDFKYIKKFDDVDTFIKIGPGAKNGLKILNIKNIYDFIKILKTYDFNINKLEILEHSLCEFYKFYRIKNKIKTKKYARTK